MQPLHLILPNSLRDAMQRALEEAIPENPLAEGPYTQAVTRIVGQFLMSSGATDEERIFLNDFHAALIALEDGTGNPHILMHNMPRERGRFVLNGFPGAIGAGNVELPFDFSGKTRLIRSHRDFTHTRSKTSKSMQAFFCERGGDNPVPTVFPSDDEVIARMVEDQLPHDPVAARQILIDALLRIQIVPEEGHPDIHYPFLNRNPRYVAGGGGIEYFTFPMEPKIDLKLVAKPEPMDLRQYVADKQLFERYLKTAEELVKEQSSTAVCSTEDHTLAFVNEALLPHARGLIRDAAKPSDRIMHALKFDMPTLSKTSLAYGYATAGEWTKLPQRKDWQEALSTAQRAAQDAIYGSHER